MKIKDIQTICMRVTYASHKRVQSALGVWNHRNGMFLLVHTDDGITGLGEIFSNFPQWSHYEKEASVHQGLKPMLIGADPLDRDGIWETIGRKFKQIGLQWGGLGIAHQVLSGLDIALWDIQGKVAGKPICELLESPVKSVPVYCSALGPLDVKNQAAHFLEMGVTAFKLKIGMDIKQDLQNLSDLRQMIGPDCLLMVDVNQGWNLDTALKMAPLLEPFNLYWVEEPLMADHMEELEVLVKKTGMRIAGGENLYGMDFERCLAKGLLRVCQPDVTKCGGITEFLKVAQLAHQYGVDVVPHFLANGIGYAATMQVMNASGALMLEYDHAANPMKDTCVLGTYPVVNGRVKVPKGPGLGVSLCEEEIRKYVFHPY
ncbi:mandelate racemase/muconate lactonizing enzyme family protein [Enterocloster aldenensis]|uniref:mandelate racemase/muconate lactonizing enzyme family protein n=1 Tax=Enterocloster aldenensis TaxID=358742 RepID=UPI0040289CBF